MNAKLKAGLMAIGAVALLAMLGVVFLAEDESPPRTEHPRLESGQVAAKSGGRAAWVEGDAGGPAGKGSGGGQRPGPGGTRPGGGSGTGGGLRPGVERVPGPGGAPQGPTALHFRCVDGEGKALSGVRIEARRKSGMPMPPVLSDSQGLAKIEGLPPGEVLLGSARHAQSQGARTFGPVRVGPRVRVVLRFARSALGTLCGKITDDQGQPVSEAQLVLSDPNAAAQPEAAGRTQSKGKAFLDTMAMNLRPDGTFRARVAPGSYAVAARGKGYTESDIGYVKVSADQDSKEVSLVVQRQGSLSGELKLPSELTNVLPLDLDIVLEITSGTERNPYTKTERRPVKLTGSFRFHLTECHPGRYRIRLEVPRPGGNRVGAWRTLNVKPGEALTGLVLELKEIPVSITGLVRDDTGRPLAGVEVLSGSLRVRTDSQGAFSLRGLDAGNVRVRANKKGHAQGYTEVNYNGARQRVVLDLARFGSVRGRVTGPAVRKIPVHLVLEDNGAYMPRTRSADSKGAFHFKDLPPGTYYLKVGKSADLYSVKGAPSVTVKAGQQVVAPPLSQP